MARIKAAITVLGSPDEIQQRWESAKHPAYDDAVVTFDKAPGDRGTEIRVDLDRSPKAGKLGELVEKVARAEPLAELKDELRHFKQQVEAGEIARSDGAPEGERAERKLKQRPAQPLSESELEKAGA
jgi:uncharacterized membrane protein